MENRPPHSRPVPDPVPAASATGARPRPVSPDWTGGIPTMAGGKDVDAELKARLKSHYDALAGKRARFRRMNSRYYAELLRYLRQVIPAGRRVLEMGCGDGFLLRRLEPGRGLGVDLSEAMVERARASLAEDGAKGEAERIEFRVGDAESFRSREAFDYVVCSDLLGDLPDIQQALENLRSACDASTRVVLHYHSVFWEPVVKLAQKLGLKSPQLNHNWMSRNDIESLLELADYELVGFERKVLMPIGIPWLAGFLNRFVASLPGVRNLCLVNFITARMKERARPRAYSTTVVIPCRNEKGTIRAAVERLPAFGEGQEIIFVDGHSTDGTPEEIKRVMAEFPDKDIKFFPQAGKGKGDAVRLAFEHATKDILMILDADLTVPPEDLPKFYYALAAHKAEFINGSRLVYPMEKEAMRFLNILGNQFFSFALTWLLNQPLKDTLCGTKVLFRKDYEKIKAGRDHFGDFDPFGDFDLLFGAARQNLKILEVPVRYRDRTYGTTNISRFRHGFLLLKMVCFGYFKLKW